MACRRGILVFVTVALQCTIAGSCEEDTILSLNDLDLRSPETVSDYWDSGDGIVLNDIDLTTAWYRTTYNGWQYIMSDVNDIPDFTACSTYWPIYLKETHPAVDQLGEDPVSVIACIRDDLQPCSTTYGLQIRKCDEEIHYKLIRTAWFSAYCFQQAFQLPTDVTPAPAPENVNFGNVSVLPELGFSKKPAMGNIWSVPYIEFRCKFDSQTGLFYSVNWCSNCTSSCGSPYESS